MEGFHPGQLSFLLRAASNTLPTAVNLQWWSIQCEAKCSLCDSNCPTAHILSCCPTVQQRYTYRHNQVFFPFWHQNLLGSSQILHSSKCMLICQIFMQMMPPKQQSQLISYHPDIVIYNSQSPTITLLELTCPLDSAQHNIIQAAQNKKQKKVEYLQLLAEFDRRIIPNYYETIEISVLSHYQLSTITICLIY